MLAADIPNLEMYFTPRVSKVMKKDIMIAYSVKSIFMRKSLTDQNENNKFNMKEKNSTPNKKLFRMFIRKYIISKKSSKRDIIKFTLG